MLPQLSGPWKQPASAAACRRVLEPDILEVSHLCGCLYCVVACIACTDDFLRVFLSQLLGPLQQPASAAACRRVLEPDILEVSPVWLYVLRTCVCIAVFDFRAYDRQLKTKLHFRGRVNNNACAQSCTTFCQLYLASAPCILMVVMAFWLVYMLADRGSTILKRTSTQKLVCYSTVTYVILLTRADDRILPQEPVP